MDSSTNFDVVVIGGGWSGILSCKYAIENGLSVMMLEKREGLGGVWRYSEDKNIATVLTSTYTTSSSALTEMSDYPMPEEIGEFPYHEDVLAYLESYCKEFNLHQHFKFNCGVEKVTKDNEYWETHTNQGEIIKSKYLINCTGLHQKRNENMKSTLFKDFKGETYHSADFKEFCDSHSNKNVMIFGGGETASDFVELWRCKANKVFWSIPNGQHFLRKCAKVSPFENPRALDKVGTRLMNIVSPSTSAAPGKRAFVRFFTNGSFLAYNGHGIPEFKSDAPYFRAFFNKQGHVLRYIEDGSVIPKRGIVSVNNKDVTFSDGSTENIDIIILCTGFKISHDILPPKYSSLSIQNNCYKMCLYSDDPTLAFIGYVRPMVGSIPSLSEVQARFVTRYFSKKIQLPEKEVMDDVIKADAAFWRDYFKDTSMRISTLVDMTTYLDDLAKAGGFFPNLSDLILRNPKGFLTSITGPYATSFYRLSDPKEEAKALATLRYHSQDNWSNIYIFLYILFRLFCIDFILDNLIEVKYWCQTKPSLRSLKNSKFIKVIDTIWKLPKTIIFDNVTRSGSSELRRKLYSR